MLLLSTHPWYQVASAQLPRSVILQSIDEVGVNQSEYPRLMIKFNKAGN